MRSIRPFICVAVTTTELTPRAALDRYDFLFLAALAIQAGMLAGRLETLEEAKVIRPQEMRTIAVTDSAAP